MKKLHQRGTLLRTTGVIAIVAVLITGVTFAALQSQDVTLVGSTITSTTANLLIGDQQGNYSTSQPGYEFSNLEPGGEPMPAEGFVLRLRNNGSSKLALRLSMNPYTFTNQGDARLNHVHILITPVTGGGTHDYSLASLLDSYSFGAPVPMDISIPPDQPVEYRLQVKMDSEAVVNPQTYLRLAGINMIFSGVSVAN